MSEKPDRAVLAAAKVGMNLRITTPENYRPDDDVIAVARSEAEKAGKEFLITSDPIEGIKGANVIVTDTWISMGQDDEKEQRLKEFKGYQVTMELGKHAADNWVFMHCLPRKPYEVDDEVFYSDRSIVFSEAENRMYTVMAVTLATLGLN